MSVKVGATQRILNLSDADLTSGNAVWYKVEGSDKVLIFITITGTYSITLELDVRGDGTKIVSLGTFTASDEKVLDDPTGKIRAYGSGTGTRTAVVDIRSVYAVN